MRARNKASSLVLRDVTKLDYFFFKASCKKIAGHILIEKKYYTTKKTLKRHPRGGSSNTTTTKNKKSYPQSHQNCDEQKPPCTPQRTGKTLGYGDGPYDNARKTTSADAAKRHPRDHVFST